MCKPISSCCLCVVVKDGGIGDWPLALKGLRTMLCGKKYDHIHRRTGAKWIEVRWPQEDSVKCTSDAKHLRRSVVVMAAFLGTGVAAKSNAPIAWTVRLA